MSRIGLHKFAGEVLGKIKKRKEKIKLISLKVFDNPLSKYLILKRIYCMQWLF